MRRRIAIIGAGLCGSLLSVLLRERFEVTVIEKGRRKQPIFSDVACTGGEVNSSINRAEGLGGTTNYWHNALIEMTDADLRKAGVPVGALAPHYAKAWALFLSDGEWRECDRLRDANRRGIESARCSVAHMVLPRARANLWQLANLRHPGPSIRVLHGEAERIVPGGGDAPSHVVVRTGAGVVQVEADHVVCCAGGLATPVLLARSIGAAPSFCGGYHDHPMAYVAKVRLRPESRLKAISCTPTATGEVRAGLVYESEGLKTVVYLRPALDLKLDSIRGPARFILSDLRNAPFSPRKIMALLRNIEAVREAILFKTKAGFRGDFYSVLLLGEQAPIPARGIAVEPGRTPSLDWHVTEAEHRAYRAGFAHFLDEFATDIVEARSLRPEQWEFRTAAHHSGAARRFLSDPGELNLEFFSVRDLRRSFVCDGSLLRAGGIANSGLTLLALTDCLAGLLLEQA